MSHYHKIDGWRGYSIPDTAVAGASDTGTWDDSPCPTPQVKAELRWFQRDCLRPLKIRSRTRIGNSSNVFCAKRWVCVPRADFERAKAAADTWLAEHKRGTNFIHNGD